MCGGRKDLVRPTDVSGIGRMNDACKFMHVSFWSALKIVLGYTSLRSRASSRPAKSLQHKRQRQGSSIEIAICLVVRHVLSI